MSSDLHGKDRYENTYPDWAVFSTTVGLVIADASYAGINTQGVTRAQTHAVAAGSFIAVSSSTADATNAATPAVPGSDGTPATPAVPGNTTAQAAYDQGESTRRLEQLGIAKLNIERPTITLPEIARPNIERPVIER